MIFARLVSVTAVVVAVGVASTSAEAIRRDVLYTSHWPEARQVSSNSSSNLAAIIEGSGSAASDDSNSSSTSSATNVTTSSGTPCDMLANVAANQQVSWSASTIQSCCTDSTKATCFIRPNDDGSGSTTVKADSNACYQVPSCTTLFTGDASSMAGFRALNSTWGKGDNHNAYYFATTDGAASMMRMTTSMYAITGILTSLAIATSLA